MKTPHKHVDLIKAWTDGADYWIKQHTAARLAELELRRELESLKTEQEPAANKWSVFNSGAEVWSNLSLADAIEEMTPSRVERGWSMVCVINKDNPPLYTAPPKRELVGLTEEDSKLVYEDVSGQSLRPQDYRLVMQFAVAIEAKLKELNA